MKNWGGTSRLAQDSFLPGVPGSRSTIEINKADIRRIVLLNILNGFGEMLLGVESIHLFKDEQTSGQRKLVIFAKFNSLSEF
jgi:hypothetical protein